MRDEEYIDHDFHVHHWYKHLEEQRDAAWHQQQEGRMRPDPPEEEDFERSYKAMTKAELRELDREARKYDRERQKEEFDRLIRDKETLFKNSVSDGKPYTDYIGLLAAHSLTWGLFFAVIEISLKGNWTWNHTAGLFALGTLGINLFKYLTPSTTYIADMVMLRTLKRIRSENIPDIRSRTFRALLLTVASIIQMVLIIGGGFIGHEISKQVIERYKQTPPASSGDTVKPTAPPVHNPEVKK